MSQFQPGQSVTILGGYNGNQFIAIREVDRITPSGIVVLKNDTRRYNPDGTERGPGYSPTRLVTVTPKHTRMNAVMTVQDLKDKIDSIKLDRINDAGIARIAELLREVCCVANKPENESKHDES